MMNGHSNNNNNNQQHDSSPSSSAGTSAASPPRPPQQQGQSSASSTATTESSSSAANTPEQRQPQQPQPQVNLSYKIEDYTPPSLSSSHDLKLSYAWGASLLSPEDAPTSTSAAAAASTSGSPAEVIAAPVSAFRHAPMSDCWDDQITVGMKVEVEVKSEESPPIFQPSFWVASILRISGYNALLRYEGFGQDGSKDFWMNVTSEKVHPVGWCATRGKPLIPPRAIR